MRGSPTSPLTLDSPSTHLRSPCTHPCSGWVLIKAASKGWVKSVPDAEKLVLLWCQDFAPTVPSTPPSLQKAEELTRPQYGSQYCSHPTLTRHFTISSTSPRGLPKFISSSHRKLYKPLNEADQRVAMSLASINLHLILPLHGLLPTMQRLGPP